MKGILNTIFVLSCAGLFIKVMSTPVRRSDVSKSHYVEYAVPPEIRETEFENSFKSENNDDCLRAVIALYKTQQYFLNNEMEEACTPINKYSKFLESDYNCENKKYETYFIKPSMAQRNYWCTKQTNGNYCDADATYIDSAYTKKFPSSHFCNDKQASEPCQKAYMTFANSMIKKSDSFIKSYGGFLKDKSYNNDNNEFIIQTKVYSISDSLVSEIQNICQVGSSSSQPIEITKNGLCGPKNGKCPSGECCSQYGYCGATSEHCDVSSGCQSEFGKCQPIEITKNGLCGSKNGKCPSGECCSQYGYCGATLEHCDVSSGCQSEFGKCQLIEITKNGLCGPKNGKCPSGECCSQFGYCGTTSEHCDVSSGCQSEFGKCI